MRLISRRWAAGLLLLGGLVGFLAPVHCLASPMDGEASGMGMAGHHAGGHMEVHPAHGPAGEDAPMPSDPQGGEAPVDGGGECPMMTLCGTAVAPVSSPDGVVAERAAFTGSWALPGPRLVPPTPHEPPPPRQIL